MRPRHFCELIGDDGRGQSGARHFAAPRDDPGALAPLADAGMACVWELEVIDFERRAWLGDVLEDGDVAAYLDRALDEALV